jgi:predicted DNA-binding protein (UPF0251 family)
MVKQANMTPEQFVELIGKRAVWEGDCLIWQLCTRDGSPVFSAPDGNTYNVRRWGMQQTGRRMTGLLACSSCADSRCIAPNHFKALTRQQLQKRTASLGGFTRPDSQAAKAKANRARATISMDTVRAIRLAYSEGVTQAEISRRFEMQKGTVWKVVMHKIAREHVANSSVFAWRPEAA